MPKWLDEFQAFRAIMNQANNSASGIWDYQKLANEFIKRFEDAIQNG